MLGRRWAAAGLVLALVVGAAFRLVWPADMEFKGDEIYSYEHACDSGRPWTWTGMNNSADVPHPGLSVWVFVGLARLTGAADPVALNAACMALNVLALALLVAFVARVVPAGEREAWWWATALVAVNPLAVQFHRKIWPPSVTPALTVVLLTAWWFRRRRTGAFAFGLVAALGAQVHPGLFFFAAGFALWAALADWREPRWRWWAAGAGVGVLPALPWLYHLAFCAPRSAAARAHWSRIFELKFWTYWLTEPFGFSLAYSLGSDFRDFLRYPFLAGRPTYLVAGLHVALAVALVTVVIGWLKSLRRSAPAERSPTGLALGAAGIGYGLLLTLTGLPVYRHYMIVLFPLTFVWLARAALAAYPPAPARSLLAGLAAIQACVSALFLGYIHRLDRPVRGDYGAPYRVQRDRAVSAANPNPAPPTQEPPR